MSDKVSESQAEIQRGNAGQGIVVIALVMNDDYIDVVAGKDIDGEVSIAKAGSPAEIILQGYLGVRARDFRAAECLLRIGARNHLVVIHKGDENHCDQNKARVLLDRRNQLVVHGRPQHAFEKDRVHGRVAARRQPDPMFRPVRCPKQVKGDLSSSLISPR